jgi:hypothetical protein
MSWWKRLSDRVFGRGRSTSEAPTSKPAKWLAAGDPVNPFGVAILDLMSNLELISATEDPTLASRSASWRPGQQERLDWTLEGERISCNLTYRAAPALPDGMLFVPTAMEEKWVIAWRSGQIAAARSWSGETEAVAETELESGRLRVTQLTISAKSSLRSFGDPVSTFDWLLKSHALGASSTTISAKICSRSTGSLRWARGGHPISDASMERAASLRATSSRWAVLTVGLAAEQPSQKRLPTAEASSIRGTGDIPLAKRRGGSADSGSSGALLRPRRGR